MKKCLLALAVALLGFAGIASACPRTLIVSNGLAVREVAVVDEFVPSFAVAVRSNTVVFERRNVIRVINRPAFIIRGGRTVIVR